MRTFSKPDIQITTSKYDECLQLADSRRLGDEIHQRPPNGDVRPLLAIRVQVANDCFSVFLPPTPCTEGRPSAWEAVSVPPFSKASVLETSVHLAGGANPYAWRSMIQIPGTSRFRVHPDLRLDVIMRVYQPDLKKMKTWKAPKAERLK